MPIQSTFGSFNPDVKDTAPGSYLGLFKPIESYESSSAFGVALKGAANMLDKGLEAANALILNEGRNQVETKLEPMRDEYTEALKGAQSYVAAATKPAVVSPVHTDLMPGPEGGSPGGTPIQAADMPEDNGLLARAEGTPQEIKNFERKLDTLDSARSDGKFSETEFWGRVRDATKDIRNRFPIGYRPEIDAMVAAKFGTTPANAYIQGMIRDINASLTDAKSQRNHMSNFLLSHIDKDGVQQIFTDFNNNKIDINEAGRRASIPLRQEALIGESMKRLELSGKDMEMDSKRAEREIQGIGNAIMTKKLSTITSAGGIDGKLNDILLAAQRGDIKLTSQESLALSRKAQALYDEAKQEILAKANTITNGRSYTSLTSPTFVDNVASTIAKPFADMRDGFHKGDVSIAAWNAQSMEAAKEDFQSKGVFDYPEMGQLLMTADMLKKYGMPNDFIQDMIRPLMLQNKPQMIKYNKFTELAKFNMATPREIEDTVATKFKTFKSGLEGFKTVQQTNDIKLPDQIDEFTKIVDGGHGISLVNTKDPNIADAIAARVFGPGNENAFKYFKDNYYDEKGRITPGSQALFNRFSHPDVVKTIMGLKTERQKEYMDFMTTTAREDLLRKDLPKLKEAINSPNVPYQLAWDTEKKNFSLVQNTNITDTRLISANRTGLAQNVNNINMVLDGLKSIATTTGKKGDDIDAFVLNPVMQTLGDISNVTGLPESLATTIRNAYAKGKFDQESEALNAKGRQKLYTSPPKGD